MPKTEKKLNTDVNKEFEQALSALNPGENLEIEKPQKGGRGMLVMILTILVLVISGAVWFFVFSKGNNLADELPNETSFYISLSLADEPQWFDRVFFWRSIETPSQNLSRLYSKLDVIGFSEVEFGKSILPLLKNKLELARLEDGGLILRTQVRDIPAWLALVRAESGVSQGELSGEELKVSGWWQYLTKNLNKITWLIKKDKLYLSDKPDWQNYLGQKRSLPKFERGVLQVFIKDKTALGGLDAPYGQFLAPTLEFPLKLVARNTKNGLVWYAGSGQRSFDWSENSDLNLGESNIISLAASNLGQIYQSWRSDSPSSEAGLLTKNINELEGITKEFYGLDLETALNTVGNRQFVLNLGGGSSKEPIFGNNWSFLIKDQADKTDEELFGYLQKFGSSLFALTHPQSVEHALSDGSEMVELRAGSDGLEWQPLEWSSQGRQYSFYSLRGQGEENGYFIGFIPARGYFFTSSLSLINQYTEPQDEARAYFDCSLSYEPVLSLIIGSSFISSDPLFNQVISKIILTASNEGLLGGCLKFLD